MAEEIWKNLNYFGYPNYEVSNFGRIKSLARNIITGRGGVQWIGETMLKSKKEKNGYMAVMLYNDGERKTYKVHRLVALSFKSNPLKKKEINHIDGNKENNNLDNLEWCTSSENQKHAFKTGLQKARRGKAHHSSKKVYMIDRKTNEVLESFFSVTQASLKFGKRSAITMISNCCHNKVKSAYGYKWSYDEEVI